jgi:hypothetical protein
VVSLCLFPCVLSANSAPTDINASNLTIAENSAIGTMIGEFNATDPDGDAITYSLVPFSPVHLSPTLWLDASDEATLVKESGVLSSWLDKSGNDRDGSSTGSSRPSISTGYNGNSMINLDGVDDIVSINGSLALNTFFVVLNSEISSEKFSKWAWVLGARGPDKTPQMVPALYGRMGYSSLTTELPFQGNRQSVISINGDDTLSQGTKDFGNFSEFKLISVSSSQTSSNLSNWKISSGEFPWKGNIAEIVVFDRPLEDHQRHSIEEYLSSKWGLTSKMHRPFVPSNSLFTLDSNGTLKTATTFDYETNASTYTITVQAKDELNATTEGNFTVTLLDVNEPPTDLNSTTELTITENQPVGTIVGEFNASDPEGGEITYSLGTEDWQTHNHLFSLDANGTLRTAKQIDYETFNRWKKVRVNATDALGETVSELFRVVVQDVNDSPVVSGQGSSSGSNKIFVQEGEVFKSGFTWDMTYGGMGNDTFRGMVPAHDGGYLIVGTSDSNKSTHKSDNSKGGTDYWLIKVNAAGTRIWDKTYGGSEDDSCSGIIPTMDGNYLLFGSSKSPDNGDKSEPSQGSSDFWILKIDPNGSKIWDKRYGGGSEDSCKYAMQLENGDFALGGSSRSGVSGDKKHAGFGDLPDYWVLRLDENGSKLWDYAYGGEDWDVSNQIGVLPDGKWLIFGYSRSNKGEFKSAAKKGGDDYWVVKVDDQNGSMIWDQSYGGASYDYLYDAHVLEDGSFFMVGASRTGSGNSGDRASIAKSEDDDGSDIWLVKADANGSILWERTFGGEGSSGWPARIEALSNGQFAISSTISGRAKHDVTDGPKGVLSTDYWLIKIDVNGNKIWDRRFEGDGYENPANLMHTLDGGILLGGSSYSHAGLDKTHTRLNLSDFWVLKLDEDGRKRTLIYDPDGDDLTWSIAEGNDGDYFEVNSSTGQILFKGANFEKPLDADSNNTYDLTLRATDPSGLFTEHNVTFVIQNVNEPPYDLNSTTTLTIAENQSIGTIVGEFKATDPDHGDKLFYRLVKDREQLGNEYFTMDENGTLYSAVSFSFDEDQTFHIRVKVSDQDGLFTKESFYVSVIDAKDTGEESDKDGDGYSDKDELEQGTDPNNKFSYPNKPILQTGYGLLNDDGSIDLTGGILEDGKGKITDFGFVLSSGISIDPKKSKVLWIRGVGGPESFKLKLTQSPYQPVLYIRAWAKNIAGYGIGPVRKVRIPEAPKPWWGDVLERPGGWKTSGWFGNFMSYEKGWLYHARLGWLYSSPASESSVWLWKENFGWLWTKEDAWPYLWSHQSGGWLYLYPGKVEETPRFYDYSSESYR